MSKKRISVFVSGFNLIVFCLGYVDGIKENFNDCQNLGGFRMIFKYFKYLC